MQKSTIKAISCRILFVLFTLTTLAATAQVTPVGTPASAKQTNTIASFTVPAGNKRLLLVTASDGAATNITGATFNGVAMTERKEVTDGYISVDAIYTLSLGDAAVPVTGNIVFTSNGPSNITRFITAAAFTKVDQTTPFSDMQGELSNTSASTVTVASSTGDLVYDIFDTWNSVLAGTQVAGGGQTIVSSSGGLDFGGDGAGYGFYSTSKKAGAASVTTSWSATGHLAEIHIAVNIKQDNFVLPVKLAFFDAKNTNNSVVLNWGLTGEADLDNMEIERSANGVDFSFAATAAIRAKEYTDVDAGRLFAANGNVFYRLKMISRHGDLSYSPIVSVKLNKQTSFVTGIQPLFTEGKIAVNLNMQQPGEVTLRLTNIAGQIIKTIQVNCVKGSSTQLITGLQSLAPGLYALQVSHGREVVTQKLSR